MPRQADDEQLRRCLALLEGRAPRALSVPELARLAGLVRWDRRRIRAALESRVATGEVRRVGKTRYRWARDSERAGAGTATRRRRRAGDTGVRRLPGRFIRTRTGPAFVEVLGPDAHRFRRDLLVPPGLEGSAMHGDRVEVRIERRDPRLRRDVARVVAVAEPAHERVIGTLDRMPRGWCLIPEDDRLPPVHLVETPSDTDLGRVALARIVRPPSPATWPEGSLERVVGDADDPQVQFLSVALGHGLPVEFPPAVVAETERLPADPDEGDFADRRDLRALPFVTIDDETARDFDDAVCVDETADGWRLFVAVADVSHYVRPGSATDAEAHRRGTSIYFPDRAIPMLPEALSAGLCSLLPGRPRLVMVAETTYDRRGHRTATELYHGVIASHARLTYTTVAALLDDPAGPDAVRACDALADLPARLEGMRALMRVLLRRRLAAGALDLDLPEAVVDLAEDGRAVNVRPLERTDAHRLIEEFMVETNQAVAVHLRDRAVPLPYRIHEPPDPADADELNEVLGGFGLHLDYDGEVRPRDVQRLLVRLSGHRLARLLARQILRSLKQARYATRNVGHFGLALPVYCHFTSPIRRLPDLLVHRQLARVLRGAVDEARDRAAALAVASTAASVAERRALEAERAMLDLKKAEFMRAHLHEPFPGTIVGVRDVGCFVELDAYPIEGLVHIDTLANGRWRYVETERALVQARSRRRFRFGDRVVVEATNASTQRREIDFALVRRLDERTTASDRRARPPRRARGGRRP